MSGSQQLLLGTGVSAVAANYIEDVFSTWLYTGNSSTQTITNGIDLSTKGGLVWVKRRNGGGNHSLFDTARGLGSGGMLDSASPTNAVSSSNYLNSFNTNGFTTGVNLNSSGDTHATWTFRKQPKFFDVVTYTGNGVAGLAISHSLGSKPGFIVVKRTNSSGDWWCWARASNTEVVTSGGAGTPFALNSTNAGSLTSDSLIVGAADATTFTPYFLTGFSNSTNINGATYVAYLFAHNAGGFGLTGTDNVISCGSFTTDGSGNATVNLGYEPQWLITKTSTTTSDWIMVDVMRGFDNTDDRFLYANTSGSEFANGFPRWVPTATGFTHNQANANQTYIYIAIRRGPMKTPTSGTSVFNPSTWVGGSGKTTGFPLDSLWVNYLPGYSGNTEVYARLIKASSTTTQSNGGFLSTSSTAAEDTTNSGTLNWSNTGYGQPQGLSNIYYALRRAPGFFDVVCGTFTSGGSYETNIRHNLGVTPELVIMKMRGVSSPWGVTAPAGYLLVLNSDESTTTANTTLNLGVYAVSLTATTFWARRDSSTYGGQTFVAYLFASCPGVSKVGTYTGTGALQTIDCGFTGGARFVLIKRRDSTGDWYVYDSANGISSGNDPYILFNSAGAQVTGTNYVDTTSVGFQVTAAAPAGLNANGGTYIFLAIA